MVHLLAWTQINGSVPTGFWVLRECRDRLCFNPRHLALYEKGKPSAVCRVRDGRGTPKESVIIVDGDIARVVLTQGKEAIVDAADADLVRGHSWNAQFKHGVWRAFQSRRVGDDLKTRHQQMHNLLMQAPDGMIVDHKDGNPLNNRRSNLRPCTRIQNRWNSRSAKRNLPKGVRRQGEGFCAAISAHGVRHELGKFATPQEAALAYDAAAVQLHGEFARTNASLGKI